jgi:hypothetical protein
MDNAIYVLVLTKNSWATIWVIFSQTHRVTLDRPRCGIKMKCVTCVLQDNEGPLSKNAVVISKSKSDTGTRVAPSNPNSGIA